ncbi:MAG: ammonium transporter [Bacteroidales bacterium]|nr:ammonium transporter [Candidatus Physcocola equi]
MDTIRKYIPSKRWLVAISMLMMAGGSAVADTVSADEVAVSLDTVWMLLAAMLVFWMQPGFALCEAGFTRRKNAANILFKNFVDFSLGSILFWFIGFGFMFGNGGEGFIGVPNWGDLSFYDNGLPIEGFLMFQTVFCATSATIVSGAMAERTKFSMYIICSIVISLIIYPISGHWTWGGGWLCNEDPTGFMMSTFGASFHDFAGSAIVHSVGGVLAFIGAIVLGPRVGKYSADGKSKAIPGHNLPMAALGVFILWLGWFGFNPGSQLAASGEVNRLAISHVLLTTNLAAVGGATAVMFLTWFKYKKPSLSLTLNGVLAGLVGITAGCDIVSPAGALAIGLISGVALVYGVEFIDTKLHIDDPVGASSVHGICGILGTILTGLFATESGLLYGHGAGFLAAQTFGVLVIDAWAAITGVILFMIIKKTHGIRVNKRIEEEGLDIYEHGESAYSA